MFLALNEICLMHKFVFRYCKLMFLAQCLAETFPSGVIC